MKELADEYHSLLHRKSMWQVKKHADTAECMVSKARITFESQSKNYYGNEENCIPF
jgi:hypothetical protein